MKRTLPLLAILFAYRVVHADPQLISETRTVAEFRAIDLAGMISVDVTVGKPASVVITGEPELVAKVTTSVADHTLVIGTKLDNNQSVRGDQLKAVVTVPDLTSVSLSGMGSLRVAGIANARLAVDLSGLGSLTIKGATGDLHAKLNGAGSLVAKTLIAKDATVVLDGLGSASVYATDSINANVTGAGSLSVHGHPARVKKSVSGLGSFKIH
jgi:hypothetical protein